jgi:hypothetical protein
MPDPLNDSEEVWKVYKDHQVKLMMYVNGCDFLKAARAIKDEVYDKQNPVYYHLICQGLEILMKMLLWHNREMRPEHSRKLFHHNLEKLYDAMIEDNVISTRDDDMIADLDWWYSRHFLRYPAFQGVFTIRPDPYNVRNLDGFIQQVSDAAQRANEIESRAELPSKT